MRVIKAFVIGAALITATAAQAAWPERPVTVVVPFAPGGIADVVARLAAEWLQTALKQPFIIENQGGAGGIIAAERIAKARPDGYTLMSTPIFQITMAPFTRDVTFDPVRDFKPIAAIAQSPFVIAVGGSFPANTLSEFISYVKGKPGELSFGSAGAGSLSHVAAAVFLKSAGLNMIHVPYRGLSLALTDLLAGNISMLAPTPVEIKPYLDSGKVKPLAVTSTERSAQLPNVPTVAETVKNPPVVTYNGLLAPGRTPEDVVTTVAREIGKATKDKAFLERLDKVGVEPMLSTPQEFAKVIAADTEFWRHTARELNLKSQ